MTSERTDFWAVEVSRNGESLVRIESNCLSGKPEFSEEDARVIRMAAEHLSAFIGPEEREPFIPCDHDYVWVQETVLGGTQYRCEKCGHVKWERASSETQEERPDALRRAFLDGFEAAGPAHPDDAEAAWRAYVKAQSSPVPHEAKK